MSKALRTARREWIIKTLCVMISVALGAGLMGTARAASSRAGDATPNFTESGNCGIYGMRGPLSDGTRIDSRIYGPFADFFGRSYSQVSSSIVTWWEPSGKSFQVHSRSYPAFQEARQNIIASGAGYRVHTGAAWTWRNISGSRQMSHHAVGNGLDINPEQNPYTSGQLITDMPASYVAAWEAAGFCWGGRWRWSKDAMHYTWRGPAVSHGLATRSAPYAPLTSGSGFTVEAFNGSHGVSGASQHFSLADRRRDGADDLYGLVDHGGEWQVQVAGAVSGFGRLGVRRNTGVSVGGVPLFADANGDGRADLWRFSDAGETYTADVYYDSSDFQQVDKSIVTSAKTSSDADIGLAVFDWQDWIPDLVVIRRETGVVQVYSSASGYKTKIHESQIPGNFGDSKIVLADRDIDGTMDILLVHAGESARIDVYEYSHVSGYAHSANVLQTSMRIASNDWVLPGDWDGDGRFDLYVVSGDRVSVWLGGVPDRPVKDLANWFTPDGPNTFDAGPICVGVCDTIGYTDPGGVWRLAEENAWATDDLSFYFGNPGDMPFLGDWDCDGVDTPGLYRRSDGYVYLRNSNTQGYADSRFYFGNPGDLPIPGDFNGDGCDTVSLYRPSEQVFYIINRLGADDRGLGAADYEFMFGNPGDKPFVGDFDGDDVDEVALHRESTGRVYLRYTHTTGIADLDFIFGNPDDLIVAGDWNGDGVDTPAIFRPSDGNWYVRLSNSAGFADHVLPFGLADRGYLPVAGKTQLNLGLSGLSEDGVSESVPLENR